MALDGHGYSEYILEKKDKNNKKHTQIMEGLVK